MQSHVLGDARDMNQQTQCVHSGNYIDTDNGGINTPVFTSSAFRYLDSTKQPYPRYFNTPNQEVVVDKLRALERAEGGIIFSSGMAAVSTAILALVKQGEHIILQDELYGGTHALATQQFDRLGIQYSFVAKEVDAIEQAITAQTRVIFIETPTNPLLGITDIEAVAGLARKKGITTIIDNTFASPINQNPLELGVDVVIHSGTKYLGGHSDLCCGALLASNDLTAKIHRTAADLGGSLNGVDCGLLERSLKTLHLRVTKQTENAAVIAEGLIKHPLVDGVFYPGLKSHPGHEIAARQMAGFGAMLSFELSREVSSTYDFLKRLQLIVPALSLGGIESTICVPAETSHRKMSAQARQRIGVTERLLRLSVGIEHPDDLLRDIQQALGS